MLNALLERLIEKPGLYEDEMIVFLYDEFDTLVTTTTISRALTSAGWSKKAARYVAKERNTDLRDFYLHTLSAFRSYYLVYIDESGCNNRIRFRRTGWSPLRSDTGTSCSTAPQPTIPDPAGIRAGRYYPYSHIPRIN